jgi:hypothetical protein
MFRPALGTGSGLNIRNATVSGVMPKCLRFKLGLWPFVIVELLPTACGGRSSLDEAGGHNSTAGTTGTGSIGHSGGNMSTGGTSIVTDAECHGQPVARPTPGNGGVCSIFTQRMLIGGVQVNVMESFNIGNVLGATRCSYPAPGSIPLNVTTTGLGYRDPNNLSVWFELSTGEAEMFPNVQLSSDCTASTGGWYFDDNSSPTVISLCPCTCQRVIATSGTIYVVNFPVTCI